MQLGLSVWAGGTREVGEGPKGDKGDKNIVRTKFVTEAETAFAGPKSTTEPALTSKSMLKMGTRVGCRCHPSPKTHAGVSHGT